MSKKKIQKLTVTALFTAISVVLSVAESFLPTFAMLPPGAKPGLSNVVIMFSAMSLTASQTFFIIFTKAFFAFLTRGAVAGAMSLCGGVFSGICMLTVFRKAKKIGCAGAGVLSAVCHNAGQMAVTVFTVGSAASLGYAPVLLLMSVVTGLITGMLLRAAIPYFKKIEKHFSKEMER